MIIGKWFVDKRLEALNKFNFLSLIWIPCFRLNLPDLYVPEPAPIDISQEECSQMESDLKRYLENGRKLDDQQDPNLILNTLSNDEGGLYVEEKDMEGNYIKGSLYAK